MRKKSERKFLLSSFHLKISLPLPISFEFCLANLVFLMCYLQKFLHITGLVQSVVVDNFVTIPLAGQNVIHDILSAEGEQNLLALASHNLTALDSNLHLEHPKASITLESLRADPFSFSSIFDTVDPETFYEFCLGPHA